MNASNGRVFIDSRESTLKPRKYCVVFLFLALVVQSYLSGDLVYADSAIDNDFGSTPAISLTEPSGAPVPPTSSECLAEYQKCKKVINQELDYCIKKAQEKEAAREKVCDDIEDPASKEKCKHSAGVTFFLEVAPCLVEHSDWGLPVCMQEFDICMGDIDL